ncbi:MAG TPA: hypothetical protein DCE41_15715, partial [Cytophagales bacterium]|nr:hypothetical protein [Cytophagales bacterium]
MSTNKSWDLRSFLDSMIFELDQARDTLAIKSINKPLTYTVKDLNLDLQLFPEYDGKQVKFVTAKPDQRGASRINISLGSITDRQVRETSKIPVAEADDIALDEVPDLDEETKDTLKKIGVQSVQDVEELERKNVNLNQVAGFNTNVGELAEKLRKLRGLKSKTQALTEAQNLRHEQPPQVTRIGMRREGDQALIALSGHNLALAEDYAISATLNDRPIRV